jgi:hypothetical protein
MGGMKPKPWTFLLIAVAGWIHRKQMDVIDYVCEESGGCAYQDDFASIGIWAQHVAWALLGMCQLGLVLASVLVLSPFSMALGAVPRIRFPLWITRNLYSGQASLPEILLALEG